jgi:hypothetical protein
MADTTRAPVMPPAPPPRTDGVAMPASGLGVAATTWR